MKTRNTLFNKFQTALDQAFKTCVSGSSNRMADIIKTNGWSYLLRFHHLYEIKYTQKPPEFMQLLFNSDYHPEDKIVLNKETQELHNNGIMLSYKPKKWLFNPDMPAPIKIKPRFATLDPLKDEKFNVTKQQKILFSANILTQHTRYGNCDVRAFLIAEYLWKNPEYLDEKDQTKKIERIELVFHSIDHTFVIVNRSGDINQPKSWGNAWVLDGWFNEEADIGIFYHVKDFPEKFEKTLAFTRQQTEEIRKNIATGVEPPEASKDNILEVICEINLKTHPYPVYEKDKESYPVLSSVSDYYVLDEDTDKNDEILHHLKFEKVLDEFKAITRRKFFWEESLLDNTKKSTDLKPSSPTSSVR